MFEFGKYFTKTMKNGEKSINWNSFIFFALQRSPIQKMRNQATDWETMVAEHVSDRRLLSKIDF